MCLLAPNGCGKHESNSNSEKNIHSGCFVFLGAPRNWGQKGREKEMIKGLKLSLCVFALLSVFAGEASAYSDGTPCENLCVFVPGGEFDYGSGKSHSQYNIGTYVPCYYTYEEIDGGTVWNFNPNRKLYINGTLVRTGSGSFPFIPAKRKGGYCIYTSMGDYGSAGWAVWEW